MGSQSSIAMGSTHYQDAFLCFLAIFVDQGEEAFLGLINTLGSKELKEYRIEFLRVWDGVLESIGQSY